MQFHQLLQLLLPLTTLFFRYSFDLVLHQVHYATCRPTEWEERSTKKGTLQKEITHSDHQHCKKKKKKKASFTLEEHVLLPCM